MGSLSAESIFAEFLSRRQGGESIDIEALCAAHPKHADELRSQHRNWRLFRLSSPGEETPQESVKFRTARTASTAAAGTSFEP